jgi:hypothetical protein
MDVPPTPRSLAPHEGGLEEPNEEPVEPVHRPRRDGDGDPDAPAEREGLREGDHLRLPLGWKWQYERQAGELGLPMLFKRMLEELLGHLEERLVPLPLFLEELMGRFHRLPSNFLRRMLASTG